MKKIIISVSVVIGLLVISYIGIMTYGWIGIQKAVDPRKGMSADASMERVEVKFLSPDKKHENILFIPKSYFIFPSHRIGGVQKHIVLRMYDINGEFVPWSSIKQYKGDEKNTNKVMQLNVLSANKLSIKESHIPYDIKKINLNKDMLVGHEYGLLKYKRKHNFGFLFLPDVKIKDFYINCPSGAVLCDYYKDYKEGLYYYFTIKNNDFGQTKVLNKRIRNLISSFEAQ